MYSPLNADSDEEDEDEEMSVSRAVSSRVPRFPVNLDGTTYLKVPETRSDELLVSLSGNATVDGERRDSLARIPTTDKNENVIRHTASDLPASEPWMKTSAADSETRLLANDLLNSDNVETKPEREQETSNKTPPNQSLKLPDDASKLTAIEDDGKCSCTFTSCFGWSMSRKEKLILFCIAIVNLTSQMCLSIMAPFFPIEANYKGVNSTTSGWIFGIFALVQFAVSPIFGKILPRLGSRYTICFGQLFSGICTLSFGFLDEIDDYKLFVGLCMVFRILLAFGCSASETATFAVTASVFPTRVATVLGSLETAIGVGIMIGPALGGVLYQIGGFFLPFLVLGIVMVMSAPVMYMCLPEKDADPQPDVESVSLLRILRIPAVIVVCLAIITASLVWSLFDPILAPHLEKFDVNAVILGLLFLLISSFYAVFSPIWGAIADRMKDCSPMLVAGFLSLGIGLLLLGPSPWLGFDESNNFMWLNVFSLALLGVSESLAIVPTFNKILQAVENAGVEDSFALFSIVSGIWSSCYALGDFAGPALGGWLTDRDGFPRCLTYIAMVCFAMSALAMTLWLWECWLRRRLHYTKMEQDDQDQDQTMDEKKRAPPSKKLHVEITPLLTKHHVSKTAALYQRRTRVSLSFGSDFIPRTQLYRLN